MSAPESWPATYGDLSLRAAMGIQAGVSWMQNLPLEEPDLAQTAIDDFRDVLRALKEHLWVLLEFRRIDGILISATPDPRELAAVRLGEVLHEFVGANPPWAWVGARISPSPWAVAARCVQAAGELMATHSDADGLPRTPDLDAVLRHPDSRAAGLAQVGDMTATLLGGVDHLALRAAQAGIAWPQVRAQLPDLSEARALARNVAGHGMAPKSAHLDDLTVANPPIRTGEPAAQFSDRMMRLRRTAWREATADHPSVETLKVYATLGIAVHAHALAFHGATPATLRVDTPLPRPLVALAGRGRAWQGVARSLQSLRSTEPCEPEVAEDFAKVAGLLRTFAPLTGDQPKLSARDRRHLGQAIGAASSMTADVGRWNQATVTRMGRQRQLYVRAASLAGDAVTDEDAVVAAKLADRCVPADAAVVGAVSDRYVATAPKRTSALIGEQGLILRAAPLRIDNARAAESGRDPIERTQS